MQRLRIYPHALREANAYYSPAKKALLFGYFPALATTTRATTCRAAWSSPACRTTSSRTRRRTRCSTACTGASSSRRNPDVLAFHEAFADIVALFQHFTFPEVLRHQIATHARRPRAARTSARRAGAAVRPGHRHARRAAQTRSASVDRATGEWRPPRARSRRSYADALRAARPRRDPGRRGVRRVPRDLRAPVADLLRIATGGTGVLPPGAAASRPGRTASPTRRRKSAQHVLNMCIRALDYCPPVDITFGDYLRALITADVDLCRTTTGYRVAFIEAFRRRGIYPRDVRTLSVESLLLAAPDSDEMPTVAAVCSAASPKLREPASRGALYAELAERLFQAAARACARRCTAG